MDIVTVTCLRDHSEMLLQAESVNLFLDHNVKCHVYVNEFSPDKDYWKETLLPYYKNHDLNLVFIDKTTKFYPKGPYTKQQYLKLLHANTTKDKYLVLDSKNFFVKPCHTKIFENQFGSGITMEIKDDHYYYNTFDMYKRELQLTNAKKWSSHHTPFVIDPNIMTREYVERFKNLTLDINPDCEFMYYSLVAIKKDKAKLPLKYKDTPNLKLNHLTLFKEQNHNDLDNYLNVIMNKRYSIVAFHREFLKKLNEKQFFKLQLYLSLLGFKNTLKRL